MSKTEKTKKEYDPNILVHSKSGNTKGSNTVQEISIKIEKAKKENSK